MSAWHSLAPRDRRALLLGGGVALLAALVAFVVRPSLQRRTLLIDQIAAEQVLLAREQAALAVTSGSASARVPTGAVADDAARRLFIASDEVAASAAFAEQVETLATAHDVWLQLVASRPATPGEAQLKALRLDVRAESDVAGLLAWLDALEHGSRLVRVEQLDLAPAGGTVDDGTAPLLLTATLLAYTAPPDALTTNEADATVAATAPLVDVSAVRDRDPFSPERRAPAVRYMPPRADALYVDRTTDGDMSVDDAPAMTLPTVHGTATDASGAAFAMCALDGGPVVVLRAGDRLGGFTVLSIERARVHVRDATGRRHVIDAMASPEGTVR